MPRTPRGPFILPDAPKRFFEMNRWKGALFESLPGVVCAVLYR
jgi:hypothetical protein